jgi:iron complex transport system substrate-binding protein
MSISKRSLISTGATFVFTIFMLLEPLYAGEKGEHCQRIVSLSPSTTETLFALGMGDNVVGVTRFCSYPPAVDGVAKVGGYMDPNYEAIVALEPDLVFTLPEQENVNSFLDKMEINYVTVDNKKIGDIFNTIHIIGETCGVRERAIGLIENLREGLKDIKHKTKELNSPRVLVSIGRTAGEGRLADVYVAGKDTYYHELLEYAGAVNACGESSIPFPMLSVEAILDLKPDIIVDLVYNMGEGKVERSEIIKDWSNVLSFGVITEDNIHAIDKDYSVIPGPRFIKLLRQLARIIHPEVDWEDKN